MANLLYVCPATRQSTDHRLPPSPSAVRRVAESNRAMWRLQEVSPSASDRGSGALKARFELSGGPGSPSTLAAQFSCEGSTLSGAEFQLLGSGYRVSLVKRRFVSGERGGLPLVWEGVVVGCDGYGRELRWAVTVRERAAVGCGGYGRGLLRVY